MDMSEFAFFPKLPKEMRLMIWKHAMPGPRMLELEYNHVNLAHDGPVILTHSDPRVAALSASQESRSEAQRRYTLSLPGWKTGQNLFLDPAIDTVVIAWNWLFESDEHPPIFPEGGNWNQIHHICFIADTFEKALKFLEYEELVERFTSLETITIGKDEEGDLGEPSLEVAELSEEEKALCSVKIAQFEKTFARVMAEQPPTDRTLPLVRVMLVNRKLD
jgi:hypothetical protein